MPKSIEAQLLDALARMGYYAVHEHDDWKENIVGAILPLIDAHTEDLSLQDLYDRVTLRLRDLYKDNQDLKAALEEKDREKAALQGLYDGIRAALAQAERVEKNQDRMVFEASHDRDVWQEAYKKSEQRVRELEDEVLGLRSDLQDLDP
jgi:hypothetical protein